MATEAPEADGEPANEKPIEGYVELAVGWKGWWLKSRRGDLPEVVRLPRAWRHRIWKASRAEKGLDPSS